MPFSSASAIAPTYAESRSRFLAAAGEAGAEVASSVHPELGLEGEELAVDVATVGPIDADRAVLIVSGTHGVEGYLGSALQTHHLRHLDELHDPRSSTALVFVHALNPHGFSWVRRVNEDNIDLNRNFVDRDAPPPDDTEYTKIADVLVPDSWSEATQRSTLEQLMGLSSELGADRLQQVISGGQFSHPTGIFYGGSEPTWSHRWLRSFIADRFAASSKVAVLDIHSGLGPWGHAELISSDRPESAAFQRQRTWWDGVISLHQSESVSATLDGEWLPAIQVDAPDTEFTSIAIEYGTVAPFDVLQALRADAVLHAHGDPTSTEASRVRAQVRKAFIDDDPSWFHVCMLRYEEVAVAAAARVGRDLN